MTLCFSCWLQFTSVHDLFYILSALCCKEVYIFVFTILLFYFSPFVYTQKTRNIIHSVRFPLSKILNKAFGYGVKGLRLCHPPSSNVFLLFLLLVYGDDMLLETNGTGRNFTTNCHRQNFLNSFEFLTVAFMNILIQYCTSQWYWYSEHE